MAIVTWVSLGLFHETKFTRCWIYNGCRPINSQGTPLILHHMFRKCFTANEKKTQPTVGNKERNFRRRHHGLTPSVQWAAFWRLRHKQYRMDLGSEKRQQSVHPLAICWTSPWYILISVQEIWVRDCETSRQPEGEITWKSINYLCQELGANEDR